MSSPKPPGRGRVLGVGKAGWVHLRPKSRTRVCSAERPLWGLGPSEMTAAPRGVPGDPVPGREGFPPCQIRWAVSCQPLSAGLRSTDESLQVSQAPPTPPRGRILGCSWLRVHLPRGVLGQGLGAAGGGMSVSIWSCCEPSPSEGSPVPTWTNSGHSGHAPLPQASRFILLAAQMCLVVMHP